MTQSGLIKKQTVFHPTNLSKTAPVNDQKEEDAIYKVEGVEFLPEGFLELDPVLYVDAYEFENELQKKMFKDNQRKVVQQRRKQYENRWKQKKRDVTIFILDEHKDKVINYLERWYFKHKRKMNEREIVHVSQLLNCDPDMM